ncbi:MAG: acyltransferase, partial [Starkeya sp.]|nr:acyltransferase [Starkeya sp.]
MKYRSEIDGLRAVAVVPVILFHAGFGAFSGGYVGVDVFFVISGYLITVILLSEIEAGTFSIARFYERRARRILPALSVVMLACLPFAWLWMIPDQLKEFGQSVTAVVFFVSNFLFWKEEGSYFAAAAELKPLLHTWSLAVEEQYYLFAPLTLAALWRFGRRRLFWMVVGVAVLSLLATEWGWRYAPRANFY